MLTAVSGDLNEDGVWDSSDADFLSVAVRDGLYAPHLDVNQDRVVDASDIDYLVEDVFRTQPGDLDLDGSVGFADFLQFSQHFGATSAVWSRGDLDGNGATDFADFLQLSGNFGFRSSFVRYVRLVANSEVEGDPWAAIGELGLLDSEGHELDKTRWSVAYVSSEELVAEYAPAEFAIDGDSQTFWHTEWAPEGTENDPAHPHEIVLDLGGYLDVGSLVYTPRQDIDNGRIVDFHLFQGRNAEQWNTPWVDDVFLNSVRPQIVDEAGIEIANAAPELEKIPDQHLDVGVAQLRIPLTAEDQDGDALSYLASAHVRNPLAEIRDAYGLQFIGDYYENLSGFGEKWLKGAAGTSYILLPDGDLLEWQGSFDETATRESLIARLSAEVYVDPSLLWDAAPELPAPALVTVDGNELVVDPIDGAAGTMNVVVSVTDGQAVARQSFVVTMQESPSRAWSEQIGDLVRSAESLEHPGIPNFIDQLIELEGTMSGRPAAEVSDLIRKLQASYQASELRIQAAEDWETQERRLVESQLAAVERIQRELSILQGEYDAAWTAISQRLDEDAAVADTGPPLFVLGDDIGPYEIGVGDTLELDLSAIHPTQLVRYYFRDDVDLDGLGTISYHPQTGLFRWSAPSHAIGSHSLTVVAEVGEENTAEVTFQVSVVANDPTIDSLLASPATISDRGTDTVTLTAQGVQHPSGRVDHVEFWLDADRDGVFDPDRYGPPRNNQEFYGEFIKGKDRLLGVDRDGSDGWTWTGLLPGLTSGMQTVFARSEYSTQAADSYSEPAAVTMQVLPTPQFDILEEISPQQDVTSSYRVIVPDRLNEIALPQFDTSLGTLTAARVTVVPRPGLTGSSYGVSDASHEIFLDVGPFEFAGIAERIFLGVPVLTHSHWFNLAPDVRTFFGTDLDAFESGSQSWEAANLSTRVSGNHSHSLPNVVFQAIVEFEYKPVEAVHAYGEGLHVDVFYRGNALYAQWYNDGVPGRRVRLAQDAAATNSWVRYAANRQGDVVAVYNRGSYTQEDVFLVAASQDGTILQGPLQLNSRNSGWYKNPGFAMNSRGEGVVAWNDMDWDEFNAGNRPNPVITVMRTFTSNGKNLGEEIEFLAHAGSADSTLAAAINESGDYLVGWTGFHTRNNISNPTPHVATDSNGVPRNYALAMHESGWAVTSDGLFGSHSLQALDPTGAPVGSSYAIASENRQLDHLAIQGNGDVTLWSRRAGANTTQGRRGTTYQTHTLNLELQTSLTPQALTVLDPRSLMAGESFEVEFAIRNEGLLEAQSVDVGFYLSHDETLTTSDRILGTVSLDRLLPDQVSDGLRATLVMPENADPFWNEGTTDLKILLSIAGGGDSLLEDIAFVGSERVPDGSGGNDGTDGGAGGPDDTDSGPLEAPYIRPEVALDQLGNRRILVTYDTIELIGRQMVATLRSFAKEASDVGARSLANDIQSKANRVELGLDTYFAKKWEMAQAREEARRRAQEALDSAKAAAEAQRVEDEEAERRRRQQVIESAQADYDREKRDRDERIETAQAERDQEVELQVAKYNEAIDLYNGIVDRGVDAFRKIVGFFRDPLKAFRDALQEAEEAIDRAEAKVEAAKQKFLTIRNGILDAFDIIVAPFQAAIDKLPTLEEIKQDALAARDKLVRKAEATYDNAVAALDEEFGDEIDRVKKNAAPVLQNPGLNSLASVIQDPGGALEDLQQQLAKLPSANPIGNPADLKKSLAEGTKAIAQGRLGDVVAQILPPEAIQAAGDFADWAKDVGGKSTDWLKEKGGEAAEWAQDGAANAEDWLLEKKDHVSGFEWNPFKPHPRQSLTMIEWLKMDHGYNTHQATIVFDLVYARVPGLTGDYLVEFQAHFAAATEHVYRAWLAHPESKRDELDSEAIFGGAQRLAMITFLAQYELNPDGSPAVTYIDDDTTWAEYAEEHADDPPPRRRGFRKPEWVSRAQGLFSLTEEQEEFCGGCEVEVDGTIKDTDGLPVGWVDPDLVISIAEQTGNENPTWGSDGTTIVDEDTGAVIGSFYVPEDQQPSTYIDFEEIPIGGSPDKPLVIPPPDTDDDSSQQLQGWNPSAEPEIHNRRIEIASKFAPNLQKNATETSNELLQAPATPVRTFYEDLNEVLGNAQSFLDGFGEGVSQSVGDLAAAAAALFKSETWVAFADSIEDTGTILGHDFTQFIEADDRLEFVKQYGSDWQAFVNHSVETVAVKVLSEYYQASPEERWGIAGKITGVIATELTVEVVGGGVLKKLGGAALDLAKKPSKAVDDVIDSPEFRELDDNYSVSKRTPIDGELLWAGMDPQHARQLWRFAQDKDMMFIVRGANPNSLKWQNRIGYSAKPVDLKLNTDPQVGLVKASRTPDGQLVDAKGNLQKDLSVDEAGRIVDAEKGPTRFKIDDDGFVVDESGNKFFGDYDLMGGYENIPDTDRWAQVSLGVPDAQGGTGTLREMNRAVGGRNLEMFQHGGNDEFWKSVKGTARAGKTDVGDTFIIVDPVQGVRVVDLPELYQLYKDRGIPWPLD